MRKVNKKIIQILSEIYTAEIGAVGIYMDQHTKCSDKGYHKFADILKEDAVQEMKHAERLMERILFLGGEVAYLKHMVPVAEQTQIADMVKMNIDIEIDAIDRLNKSISDCFSEKDTGTRLLLEEILEDEEKHLDGLQIINDNIKRFGDQYIVTHLI